LGPYELEIYTNGEHSTVTISAPTRKEIELVSAVFEKNAEACKLPGEDLAAFKIFIGHGHSDLWKELKDHLRDQHQMEVEAYEIGSRAGHSIRDILEQMLDRSSMAFLVMTGEDRLEDGKLNPRLNVVHETGLFQGRLGFLRAIVLLEEGTEAFSNIDGIHQIRFQKGNIREAFGDVVAAIRREIKQGAETEEI
jgi:predicted nucleotide-binding protein